MEAFEIKMKPIVVNEEPSRKVNQLFSLSPTEATIQTHVFPISGQLQDPGRQAPVRYLRPVPEAERHDLQGGARGEGWDDDLRRDLAFHV